MVGVCKNFSKEHNLQEVEEYGFTGKPKERESCGYAQEHSIVSTWILLYLTIVTAIC